MINIFRFGTCRTNYITKYDQYSIKKHNYNTYFLHYTKEILQIIDFYNDISLMENCKYPELFPLDIIKNDIQKFKEADVFLIEISATHCLIDEDGIYYNLVIVDNNENFRNSKKLMSIYQTQNEIYEDIQKIKDKLKKPIIFQGHINLKYDGIFLNSREIIDKAIQNEKYKIIFKDIFSEDSADKVCTKIDNKIDSNHLSEYGYEKLWKNFEIFLNEIFNKNNSK